MPSKFTQPKIQNQKNPTLSLSQQKISVGPIPPAEELEAYERVYPGAAERIFDGFDEERKHRHQRENKEIDGILIIEKKKVGIVGRGQLFAFILGLIILTCCAFRRNNQKRWFIFEQKVVYLIDYQSIKYNEPSDSKLRNNS